MAHIDWLEAEIWPKNYKKFQVFQQSLNFTSILAISRPLINLYAPYFQEMLIYICVIIWNQKFWNQRKLFFWLYMGILKSLGAPDTRQTCFFRSFFVIDLFYIAKVTSFYGVLFFTLAYNWKNRDPTLYTWLSRITSQESWIKHNFERFFWKYFKSHSSSF